MTRRTVLKAIGAGGIGALSAVRVGRPVTAQSVGETVFADEFDDGQLAWTDVDHPEFWTETGEQVQYRPTSSAGDVGDNFLYADETFDDEGGTLRWPLALEVRGYASDTSAGLGASLVVGGPERRPSNVVLGVRDTAYTGNSDTFSVWNSAERLDVGSARENGQWYTYRLVPEVDADRIHVYRNDEHFTVEEPRDDPIGGVSVVLSGGTCWGCGGPGHRRYEYVSVSEVDECEVDAAISTFSVADDTVRSGETVEGEVTVRNTGSCRHEYFVGFGVVGPNGTNYDNDGSTGTAVAVEAGETATVAVDWTVESNAPPGAYDAAAAVWRESDRDSLETRLTASTREDAFRIERGGGSGASVSGSVVDVRGRPVADATVRIFGMADQRELGTATTDRSGVFAFDQWSAATLRRYRDQYQYVVLLLSDGSWFRSQAVAAESFLRPSSDAEFTLWSRLLDGPTLVRSDGVSLGVVTVWRDVMSDGEGVLHVEVTNVNNRTEATDLANDAYDLSSGIFSWRLPETSLAVDYGQWDDVDVGGGGLNASRVAMAPTAEGATLSAYHPETTGLPLHAGATHYGVYDVTDVSGDPSMAEEGASRVIGTVPGLSTFANWADNLSWIFGDPFEVRASVGDPGRADPNETDHVLGPWNSDALGPSEEASVLFSVPFRFTSGSAAEATVVADWECRTALGFGEGKGSFAGTYTVRRRPVE